MKRRVLPAAAAVVLLLAAAAAARLDRRQGAVDRSFGRGGSVKTVVGLHNEAARLGSVLVQSDGRAIAAGGSGSNFVLARYGSDGALDPSFGADGTVYTSFGGRDSSRAAALRPDGRIVVVGRSSRRLAIARYLPDGRLDRGFGRRGRVINAEAGGAFAVALQPNGGIVTAGASGAKASKFELARYRPNGKLDRGFGRKGLVRTGFRAPAVATAVAVQADGKIVAAGHSGEQLNLARYMPDGRPDRSFGMAGRIRLAAGSPGRENLVIQPDGRILVSGVFTHRITVWRFDSAGNLDPSFGEGGRLSPTPFGSFPEGGLALAADGAILVSVGDEVFRYDSDGQLDAGFGDEGVASIDQPVAFSELAVAPDGRIVAAGGGVEFVLGSFSAGGAADAGFGAAGVVRTPFPYSDGGSVEELTVLPNRQIVAAGSVYPGSFDDQYLAVARYRRGGALDRSFGDRGIAKVPAPVILGAAGVVTARGGRIVAGVTRFYSGHLFGFLSSGQPDTGFGKQGHLRVGIGLTAIARRGRTILVAGGHRGGFALNRYLHDGRLYARFGNGGRVRTSFGKRGIARRGVVPSDLAIDGRGRIVLAGGYCGINILCADGQRVYLARYLPNGRLDRSFGGDGKLRTRFGKTGAATGVAIYPNGKILVTIGDVCPSRRCRKPIALIRFLPDGRLDRSFGGDGRVGFVIGRWAWADTVLPVRGGKSLLAGHMTSRRGRDRFLLLRLTRRGRFDRRFGGGDGIVTAKVRGGVNSGAETAAWQGRRRVVLGGDALWRVNARVFDSGFALMRFTVRR